MSASLINKFKCNECGDLFYALYKCSSCEKKDMCSKCIAWAYVNEDDGEEKRPLCLECFDKEYADITIDTASIRRCIDCQKLCRCDFSICWTCHKTDVCDDCITTYRYDDGEELCTACSEAKIKNDEERERNWREEYRKRQPFEKRLDQNHQQHFKPNT